MPTSNDSLCHACAQRSRNIFQVDRIIIPVNIGNVHWTLAVIDVQNKRIEYYDGKVCQLANHNRLCFEKMM